MHLMCDAIDGDLSGQSAHRRRSPMICDEEKVAKPTADISILRWLALGLVGSKVGLGKTLCYAATILRIALGEDLNLALLYVLAGILQVTDDVADEIILLRCGQEAVQRPSLHIVILQSMSR